MAWVYLIVFFIIIYVLKKMGTLGRLYNSLYVNAVLSFDECTQNRFEPEKKALFQDLHDIAKVTENPLKLLEIGSGGGSNFSFYPRKVQMVCLEPKREFRTQLENSARLNLQPVSLEVIHEYANDLEMFDDHSFDAVIITMVMCSIIDHRRLLTAVKRVLKPGSKLYYFEHVREEGWMGHLQDLVSTVWPYVFDGCSHARETWKSVEEAGFSSVSQRRFSVPMPLHYITQRSALVGTATK